MHDALAGFALALSLIVAIGAQNVFVLQQGIMRQHVLAVVLTCAISDAILVSIGVGGVGWIAERASWLEGFLTLAGVAFLVVYGFMRFFRALFPGEEMRFEQNNSQSMLAAIGTCLALTWLNPHVYLDTVVLLGTISTNYANPFSFGVGAVLASFFFFFSLGYGAKMLTGLFAKPEAWRILDCMVAFIMWGIALRLAIG